jgi:hypothetical protein
MSDSNSNSSSSENNDPRTPASASLRPTNTTRALTPSKLPKLKPISTRFPLSPSRPQTQSSPVAPTTPLDWGGEFSRLVEDVKKGSPADLSSRPSAEQDSLFDEESDDEILPKVQVAPAEEAVRALQSAISFEATFGEDQDHEGGDAKESTTSLPTASEEQEQDIVTTSPSSRPEHVTEVPTFDTNTDCCDSDAEQSMIDLLSTVSESLASAARAVEPTKSADVPFSPIDTKSGRPPGGTFKAAKSTKSTNAPSSQTVLRGLIRGAHREMMYFTLPHERFSLNDLRQGLDYAFGMLQAAQSKLAILEVLHDMPDLDAVQLRSWMTQIDHLDSQTRREPRMFVVFESLSSGEIRVALAEVVQSRLIVEDEVRQTKTLLTKRLTELTGLESNSRISALLGAWLDLIDSLQNETAGTADGLFGEKEAEWDPVFKAVMAVIIVGLYLCLRVPE